MEPAGVRNTDVPETGTAAASGTGNDQMELAGAGAADMELAGAGAADMELAGAGAADMELSLIHIWHLPLHPDQAVHGIQYISGRRGHKDSI